MPSVILQHKNCIIQIQPWHLTKCLQKGWVFFKKKNHKEKCGTVIECKIKNKIKEIFKSTVWDTAALCGTLQLLS